VQISDLIEESLHLAVDCIQGNATTAVLLALA
jgi:hypothetical protein